MTLSDLDLYASVLATLMGLLGVVAATVLGRPRDRPPRRSRQLRYDRRIMAVALGVAVVSFIGLLVGFSYFRDPPSASMTEPFAGQVVTGPFDAYGELRDVDPDWTVWLLASPPSDGRSVDDFVAGGPCDSTQRQWRCKGAEISRVIAGGAGGRVTLSLVAARGPNCVVQLREARNNDRGEVTGELSKTCVVLVRGTAVVPGR